ncbi:hypothetical protein [Streptomyces phytophilus]|uniref:hypothetical protein n=1 Tax=Streptomyces phytophilus TaxID=722715 RepID=UPI0015F0A5B9|nr:hypothetical protein [Streptomyces phytophilus]
MESEGAPRGQVEAGNSIAETVDKTAWPQADVDSGLAKDLKLPVEAYLQTYPEQVTIQQANNTLQRDCMGRFGFDFAPPAPGSHPPGEYNSANMKRRYGITDLGEARQHGYQPPEPVEEWTPYEPEGEVANYVFDLTVSEGQSAPTGQDYQGMDIPEGGCRGESDRIIGEFGDELASKINVDTFQRLKQDPRAIQVNQEWAACMQTRGYSFTSPLEAIDQAFSAPADGAAQDEISQAVADVECKKSTDLVNVYFSVETEMQEEEIGRQRPALDEQKEKNDQVVQNAAAYS